VNATALRPLLLAWPALWLGLGLTALALRWPQAKLAFAVATVPVLLVLLVDMVRSLVRGEVGLDLLAALSMGSALGFGEYLAGAVVALMFAGGTALEAFARHQARREMTALLARQPRRATRYGPGGLEELPVEALAPGDRLLIRQGEVVPVDGIALAAAVLDTAALTGESLPVTLAAEAPVMSGSTNAGEAFDLLATRAAAESTFAGILRLVEQAQAGRAPMARLADRWSLVFLLVTLAIAGVAWAMSGDPRRVLAVLVVATPCPLILAVPVALIAGLSRAAKAGVLVKSGTALETLGRVRVLLLDKTGTLTQGRVALLQTLPAPGMDADRLLRLPASLDQASAHPVAAGLAAAARARDLTLSLPDLVHEEPGAGIVGQVAGQRVALGGAAFIAAHGWRDATSAGLAPPGTLSVFVTTDGQPAGLLLLADPVREDAGAMLAKARAAGIRRIVLVSGDTQAIAEAIAAPLGLDAVHGGCSPADKVAAVEREKAGGPTVMVGDGVNDAPALAAADIGVAMGARGTAASAEAADAVVLVDRIDRIADAMRIARRARDIALQSVAAGIGLSLAGMLVAAAGGLTPVQGAVFQEAIDIAVILNALRALRA